MRSATEYAAGLKNRYLKQVYASEGYTEDVFLRAVYVNAVSRAAGNVSRRIKQLIRVTEDMLGVKPELPEK